MDSGGDCETEEDSAPEASCVSPEGPSLPSSSREMRNRAEKMRRDKLNAYINELAQLVPMIARSAKKMDKTSILRLTATHLRIYQIASGRYKCSNLNIPNEVDQDILEQLVLEQLGGFLLVLTPTGKIVFVSQTVEHLLNHLQTDLMGHSIFNITAPEDHDILRMYIGPDGLQDPDHRKQFNVRLRRAGPRTESAVYELCSIMGIQTNYKLDDTADIDCISEHSSNSSQVALNNDILIFFVKVCRPEPLSDRLLEASKDEYITRHLVDGRIINCDQRISYIAGYMSEEVSGLSAFNFMHKEDVRWVMIALRQMYDRGESRGYSCYRLLSRTGQFIYLKTSGFLEVGSSGVVESFVCVNTLVTEKEAKQLIKEMKERYSAMIKSSPCSPCSRLAPAIEESSVESVEDPDQLKEAISHLITNLASPGPEVCSSPSPQMTIENQDCTSKTEFNKSYSSSRNCPLNIHLKPLKRPITTYEVTATSQKRKKGSPTKSPPYQRSKITEISVSTEDR
nr:met1 [Lasioderma serricorne]